MQELKTGIIKRITDMESHRKVCFGKGGFEVLKLWLEESQGGEEEEVMSPILTNNCFPFHKYFSPHVCGSYLALLDNLAFYTHVSWNAFLACRHKMSWMFTSALF